MLRDALLWGIFLLAVGGGLVFLCRRAPRGDNILRQPRVLLRTGAAGTAAAAAANTLLLCLSRFAPGFETRLLLALFGALGACFACAVLLYANWRIVLLAEGFEYVTLLGVRRRYAYEEIESYRFAADNILVYMRDGRRLRIDNANRPAFFRLMDAAHLPVRRAQKSSRGLRELPTTFLGVPMNARRRQNALMYLTAGALAVAVGAALFALNPVSAPYTGDTCEQVSIVFARGERYTTGGRNPAYSYRITDDTGAVYIVDTTLYPLFDQARFERTTAAGDTLAALVARRGERRVIAALPGYYTVSQANARKIEDARAMRRAALLLLAAGTLLVALVLYLVRRPQRLRKLQRAVFGKENTA